MKKTSINCINLDDCQTDAERNKYNFMQRVFNLQLDIISDEVGDPKVAAVFFDMMSKTDNMIDPKNAYPLMKKVYKSMRAHPEHFSVLNKSAFILILSKLLKEGHDNHQFYLHMIFERINDLLGIAMTTDGTTIIGTTMASSLV